MKSKLQFDKKASEYNHYSNVQENLIEWGLDTLKPSIEKNQSVLELGAGTGLLTRFLKNLSFNYIASDESKAMLKIGKKIYPELKWVQKDAWKISDCKQWDWVISSSLLQWCPNPIDFFLRIRKSLNPKGSHFHLFYSHPSLVELQKCGFRSPLQWRGLTDWESYLLKSGFRSIQLSSQSKTFWYDTAIASIRTLHQVGATYNQLTPYREMKRILQDYQSIYQSSKGIPATWNFSLIKAEI